MHARLDPAEHARHPWRIAEIAPDFALVDAWALPASGRLEEFADLRQVFVDLDPSKDAGSSVARALFGMRAWLGERFGWD